MKKGKRKETVGTRFEPNYRLSILNQKFWNPKSETFLASTCCHTWTSCEDCTQNAGIHLSQMLVAHACNPSYMEGRDQEDHNSRSAWANNLREPITKLILNTYTKKGWEHWLKW
jgi:hypothetical protein